ncbi:MAG: hypothetical protein JNL45_13840 [Hyphomicrobium sp.]|jgi:hypothetical protein|nr:hypothetical protein [Hyphomicrobium sp.]
MRLTLNTVLFNAAGAGILLFLGVYMTNSFFHNEELPVCRARYGNGLQFSLQSPSGKKLSNIELQARVPTREWGLLKNARVIESQDGKAQYLQVALGPAAGSEMSAGQDDGDESDANHSDGVGFVWAPPSLEGARAACLSFRLFLPKDFSFDIPGKLPGLYATRTLSDLDDEAVQSGFVSRLGWQKGGAIGVTLTTPDSPDTWLGTRKEGWPVGRWVDISQEVVLNAPGKSDGLMRVWIDGALRLEKTGLNLGVNEGSLSGVVADLGYEQKSPAAGRLTISPFIIQRQ